MRKYQRSILKAQAEKKRCKVSKYVHDEWTKYQLSFRSPKQVAMNKARGTRKKSTWKEHVSFALAKLAKGVA